MAGVAVAGRYHAGDAQVVAEVFLSDWERARPVAPTGHGCGRRPFSFAAVERLLGAGPDGGPLPTVVVAGRLGVDGRQVIRWRSYGTLTERQADELATRLGQHPAAVWPNWLDDLGEPLSGS